MELKQAARLASYTGADANQDNLTSANTQISKQLEGTPLRLVKNEEGWFVALQNNRITEIFKDENDVYTFLQFGDNDTYTESNDQTEERILNYYAQHVWKTICVLAGVIAELALDNKAKDAIKDYQTKMRELAEIKSNQTELFNNINQ